MNDFRLMESILKRYNEIKGEIKLLELKLGDEHDEINSRGLSYKDLSPWDKKRIDKLTWDIRVRERMIEKVDSCMDVLNEEQKGFVNRRFFQDISMSNLAKFYNVVDRTMYHRKDVILKKLWRVYNVE